MALPEVISWEQFLSGKALSWGKVAAAIGVFDGVHLGHRALLERVVASGLTPAAVTFASNPKAILRREGAHGDLLTTRRKIELLGSFGMTKVLLIDFSRDFSILPGREFLSRLWEYGSIRYLAVGHDFRCGFHLDTDAEAIRSYGEGVGFKAEIVDAVLHDGHPVSSSRIRRDVAAGRLRHAAALLDRPHELDIRNLTFTESDSSYVFSRAETAQVLPPDGSYEVVDPETDGRLTFIVDGNRLVLVAPPDGYRPGTLSFVPNA